MEKGSSIVNSKVHSGTVATGADLDSITTAGIYMLSGNNTYEHCPSTYGILEVSQPYLGYSANAAQKITTVDTVYTRYKDSSGWYPWKTISVDKVAATNLPNTIYCVKVGKVCYLTFEHSSAFTAEADSTICTLPVGFRPHYAVSFVCPLTGYRISVGISGVISCSHALNGNVLRGGITYIISD